MKLFVGIHLLCINLHCSGEKYACNIMYWSIAVIKIESESILGRKPTVHAILIGFEFHILLTLV
jgi:hypothetical protein